MASVRKRTWKAPNGESKTAWLVDYGHPRQRKHFPTKKAADAFRIDVEGQMQSGAYRAGADKVTVRQACAAFLQHCEGRHERDERMTRHTLSTYRGHIKNHVLHSEHGVGSQTLAQLSAREVGAFRDRLRSSGVTVVTTREILGTLQGVLGFAIGQDWIAVNSARGVRTIGTRDEGGKKVVPPTKAALQQVLAAADPWMHLAIQFAAATGCRASEQWAIRWRHIQDGMLRIERRVDAYLAEGPPKSRAGIRSVPLSGQLVAVLKAWRLRSKFSRDDDLIFPDGAGGYTRHSVFAVRFARLQPGFTWHGLRHFAVSTWIEAGLPPKTVQTFAGHSNLAITHDRYGHLFPSPDHQAAMDRIGRDLFK
jgi:integrase